MKISVFGLGYVGCVSAACLTADGHEVFGVDVDTRKVNEVNEGNAPFFEPGLGPLLLQGRQRGTLTATTNEADAIRATEMALVCVGTPSVQRTGEIRLEYLRNVFTSIGEALRTCDKPFTVVLRSTVMPNVIEQELLPTLVKVSRRTLNNSLEFCYNPEFLREGTAIRDFYDAPMVIVGHTNQRAAEGVSRLYSKVKAPVIYTDIRTACLVKYVCNAFHALKVAFANEIGQLGEHLDVDVAQLMEIVCRDAKLNISPAYLRPGFAFGGSCLPKDLRAIVAEARRHALFLPVLQSILPSNKAHLESCIESVLNTGRKKVGLFGLTFKEGTDDLRDSPAVALAETLIGKGLDLMIYEPAISPDSIHGKNLEFIETNIPHIWKLLTSDLGAMIRRSDVVVLLKKLNQEERLEIRASRTDQTCIDFAGTLRPEDLTPEVALFAQTILPLAPAAAVAISGHG
jgi:GDP-mannose 6-dehydrogenase